MAPGEEGNMKSPRKLVSGWLERPQVTNGEALVVGVLGGLVTSVIIYAGGALLKVSNLVDFESSVPVWLAAVIAGVTLAFGLLLGARRGAEADVLRGRIVDLEALTKDLDTYQAYAEHLRDALADLRKALAGELPAFSLRDFIENGLFEPAQRLLARSGDRGEIRFSILHPDDDDFVMSGEHELFPALGHSPEGRQQFRMPKVESFSLHAYQHGKVFASGHLSEDERFTPHQKATRPYESIVSIPLWKRGEVDGVLNVVATQPDAFNAGDRSYLALLGPIIDVARAAKELAYGEGEVENAEESDGTMIERPNEGPAELPPGPTPD